MFQELFETSKTIACVETASLRVIHKSILHEALKKEDNEELEEVLTALTGKYEEPISIPTKEGGVRDDGIRYLAIFWTVIQNA